MDKHESNEKSIITGSNDGTVKIWNFKGDCLNTIQMGYGVNALSLSELGRILVTGLDNGEIVLYDLVEGRELKRYLGHEKEVTSVGINMNNNRVLTDYMVCFWTLINKNKNNREVTEGINGGKAYLEPNERKKVKKISGTG